MFAADPVRIGLNYPRTGPYATQGLDQLRAAELARDEINAAGGILGRPVEFAVRDTQSKPPVAVENARELIDKEKVTMVFGGASSGVAVAVGGVCQEAGVPFFGTLTYSTDTTGKDGQRFLFRECNDSYAAAKVLGAHMREHFAGKSYFYITADYTWGHTTEATFRAETGTADLDKHKGIKTPFPGATAENFVKAITLARLKKPDVLVMVEFGKDMELAIREAKKQGITAQIVVPNLTLGMAEDAGPENMAGVLGSLPWSWNIPGKYGFARGQAFVEAFASKYNRYPCTSGASAYTILHEYKAAVERAGSFEGPKVVKALEGHRYTLLKDEQVWRAFDHQSVQTVYAVRCKPAAEVTKDRFKQDYFEVIASMPGDQAFIPQAEWTARRTAAGKPETLQKLPGE
jgi:ABC-type branched-subunit amino acid transport system substrate-binding protein